MKLNRLFKLINQTPTNFPGMQLAYDKKNKPYWFKPIASPTTTIEFDNQKSQTIKIEEQHVTIYEKYNDKHNYITAFHITSCFTHPESKEPLTSHCYFDINNVYRSTLIKCGKQRYQAPAVVLESIKA